MSPMRPTCYFNSGFDEALIVTLDGYGSGLSGSVNLGRGGRIERLHGQEYPALAGNVLRVGDLGARLHAVAATRARLSAWPPTATRRYSASAASPPVCREQRRLPHRRDQQSCTLRRLLASQFPKIDVAAAYQRVLEEVAVAYVRQYVRKTGCTQAGRYPAACRQRQAEPAPREIDGIDGSSSIRTWATAVRTGAALSSSRGNPADRRLKDVYFGPALLERADWAEALRTARLPFTEYRPVEHRRSRALLAPARSSAASTAAWSTARARSVNRIDSVPRDAIRQVNQWLNKRLRPDRVHAVRTGDTVRASATPTT